MNLELLIEKIKSYNSEAVDNVLKAYNLANDAHKNQKRESGEPYIIHPINVCYNLATLHADEASLVAGMLHDVVEDTEYTLSDIENLFDSEVALLVDGVTKISNVHYTSKNEATNANIRRLIISLNKDVRIIIIKLCDRLHNMQTLEFKERKKQIRSANETLNIFVPLAYFLGMFHMKCYLEDLCLLYLNKETYNYLNDKQNHILDDYEKTITKINEDVKEILNKHHIKYESRTKVLNIYHIYEKINKGYKLNNLHDLVNFKIIVENVEECYQVLGLIHQLYTPINSKFKDYIAVPKTNMYKSLHTTVFAPFNHLIQFQIKTKEMDEVNTLGLCAYWNFLREHGFSTMQEELKKNYQFFNTLNILNIPEISDEDFINRVKNEIFTSNIYVYTATGEIVELPANSTVIDFAYSLHTDIGNHLSKAFVNGKEVKLFQTLNNKDRIILIPSDIASPKKSWLNHVKTTKARRKIEYYLK